MRYTYLEYLLKLSQEVSYFFFSISWYQIRCKTSSSLGEIPRFSVSGQSSSHHLVIDLELLGIFTTLLSCDMYCIRIV